MRSLCLSHLHSPSIRDQRIWPLQGPGWIGVWGESEGESWARVGSVRTTLASGVTGTQNHPTMPGPQEKLSLTVLKGAKTLTACNFDMADI